jgi:hypothetical protein
LVWVWVEFCSIISCCHPVDLFVRVDRILEIRIWCDRNGNCLVVANGSGLSLVVAGSLWFVIIPKSKDWFMEQPPMRTVQP